MSRFKNKRNYLLKKRKLFKLFKLLKKALNEKCNVTIIVFNLSQVEALEIEAKRLGKEVIRPCDNCIIIDNKIFVTTAEYKSFCPIKRIYVFVDVLKESSSEHGKRCQELYWV